MSRNSNCSISVEHHYYANNTKEDKMPTAIVGLTLPIMSLSPSSSSPLPSLSSSSSPSSSPNSNSNSRSPIWRGRGRGRGGTKSLPLPLPLPLPLFKSSSYLSVSSSSSSVTTTTTTTKIRIMFVLLSLITIWYNTKNSINITSTLAAAAATTTFMMSDVMEPIILQQQQGCADYNGNINNGNNKGNGNGNNSKNKNKKQYQKQYQKQSQKQSQKRKNQHHRQKRQKRQQLTSQTYVISFHSKKVTETFRKRNIYTGFYNIGDDPNTNTNTTTNNNSSSSNYYYSILDSNIDDSNNNQDNNSNYDNDDNDVIWFPSVNGYDPIVLKEWDQISNINFPLITPGMGRKGFRYPIDKNEMGYSEGMENTTNGYLSPHVIGCYESHRRLLTFISKSWNLLRNKPYPKTKYNKQDDDDDDDDEDDDDDDDDENQTQQHPIDALFIFEDDSVCVDDTKQQILNEVIPLLPDTWDILYIGGKPYSYLENTSHNDGSDDDNGSDSEDDDGISYKHIFKTKEEREHFMKEKDICDYRAGSNNVKCPIFRQYACNGTFGTSSTGPFGSANASASASARFSSTSDTVRIGGTSSYNGSNNNTTTINKDTIHGDSRTTFHPYPYQSYWKTSYILDTHAYVINPKHIEKVIKILNDMMIIENPIDNFRPIDVTLADNLSSSSNDNQLNSIQAYLPSKGEYCKQVPDDYDYEQQEKQKRVKIKQKEHEERSRINNRINNSKPIPWQGYYHHNSFGVIWEELYFNDCPDSYLNGLL